MNSTRSWMISWSSKSVLTHSGQARKIARPDLDPRFAWMAGRLHGAVIEDPPRDPNPWVREWGQREAVWARGAASLDPADDDLVIISDLDEVPYPEAVDHLAWSEFEEPHYVRPHWFNFNWATFSDPGCTLQFASIRPDS